jgi:hypothetical protein
MAGTISVASTVPTWRAAGRTPQNLAAFETSYSFRTGLLWNSGHVKALLFSLFAFLSENALG